MWKTYITQSTCITMNCKVCKIDLGDLLTNSPRKYCEKCARKVIKERALERSRIAKGVVEKPCNMCGKDTFRRSYCSNKCLKRYYKIQQVRRDIRSMETKLKKKYDLIIDIARLRA